MIKAQKKTARLMSEETHRNADNETVEACSPQGSIFIYFCLRELQSTRG